MTCDHGKSTVKTQPNISAKLALIETEDPLVPASTANASDTEEHQRNFTNRTPADVLGCRGVLCSELSFVTVCARCELRLWSNTAKWFVIFDPKGLLHLSLLRSSHMKLSAVTAKRFENLLHPLT